MIEKLKTKLNKKIIVAQNYNNEYFVLLRDFHSGHPY